MAECENCDSLLKVIEFLLVQNSDLHKRCLRVYKPDAASAADDHAERMGRSPGPVSRTSHHPDAVVPPKVTLNPPAHGGQG